MFLQVQELSWLGNTQAEVKGEEEKPSGKAMGPSPSQIIVCQVQSCTAGGASRCRGFLLVQTRRDEGREHVPEGSSGLGEGGDQALVSVMPAEFIGEQEASPPLSAHGQALEGVKDKKEVPGGPAPDLMGGEEGHAARGEPHDGQADGQRLGTTPRVTQVPEEDGAQGPGQIAEGAKKPVLRDVPGLWVEDVHEEGACQYAVETPK